MPRITKTVTLSLPPEMDKKISLLMKKEGRTRSELLREARRRYMEDGYWGWRPWQLRDWGVLGGTEP